MELSPKSITGVQFPTVRKGYDPEEVRSFLSQLARGVEAVQAQAAAADARARSAVAKLTELQSKEEADPVDSMRRTLLLAQKTADAAVAEAEGEARAIVTAADEKAHGAIAEAEARAEQLIIDAQADARRAGAVEASRVEAEVRALVARRDELHAEATVLAELIATHRQRITTSLAALHGAVDPVDALHADEVPARSADPAPVGDTPPGVSWFDDTTAATPVVAEPTAAQAETPAAAAPVPAAATLAPPVMEPVANGDDDFDVSGELARLSAPPRLPLEAASGPITQEVPVVRDDELVKDFFETTPYSDDRWKGRGDRN